MTKQHQFYSRPPGLPPPSKTKFQPTHSIDLHGYRKSEGIKALTSFLDQVVSKNNNITSSKRCRTQPGSRNGGDIWVCVITGSGAHSPEGPVLRDAIKNLLDKRQMEYVINRGKGSFNVNATSGITFYEPQAPIDSKVILKPTPDKIPALPKGPRVHDPSSSTRYDDDDDVDGNPTLQEVAAIDKAIAESRAEQLIVVSQEQKEQSMLKRAASMSLLDLRREKEEENEMMKRAVSMSLIECNWNETTNPDEDLQRALELSQIDYEPVDEDLQLVLELSRNII